MVYFDQQYPVTTLFDVTAICNYQLKLHAYIIVFNLKTRNNGQLHFDAEQRTE